MKKFNILVLILVSTLLFSCNGKIKKEKPTVETLTNRVEVIDFHSTHRCMTCNAIEANTRYTLDTYFSGDLKNNTITLQVINVDMEENESIAEKFEATGTALFINVIVDGKETPIDLTEFAFMEGNDQEAFSSELKAKIDEALKKI